MRLVLLSDHGRVVCHASTCVAIVSCRSDGSVHAIHQVEKKRPGKMLLLNCTNKRFLDLQTCQRRCCLYNYPRSCGGACICRKTARAQKSRGPLGKWTMNLYGMCLHPCPEVYGSIATWSNCSVIFTEHAHVHGRMETAQHNIEGAIIYYVYGPGPGSGPGPNPNPDPDTYERRHNLTSLPDPSQTPMLRFLPVRKPKRSGEVRFGAKRDR